MKLNKKAIKESTLFSMCDNAYSLIKSGKEKQAKKLFPMEYHFIEKYWPKDNEEFTSLFKRKLDLY
jgi:hypothetical protein